MALATRCPHCHTTFRVAHDQLKLRGGIVRCGQCRQVFNGIEHLLPPAGVQPAANPGAGPETGLPSGAEPDSEPVAPAAEPHAAAATTPSGPDGGLLDELDYGALEGMTLIHFPPAEQPAEPDYPHPATQNAAPQEPAAPEAAQQAGANTDPAKAPASRAEVGRLPTTARQAAAALEQDTHQYGQEEPGFVTAARRRQHQKRRTRLLFGIGSAILALALLAQAAYALRHQMAAHLPQTKPVLLAICRTLGCSIALPAQIEAISIESSELQAQPGTAGTLVLTLLLRNRSTTVQTWPDIELTLNDGNERAILRRVFTPREFPLAAADIADGFAADAERTIRLRFTLPQSRAAGYRVALFYP